MCPFRVLTEKLGKLVSVFTVDGDFIYGTLTEVDQRMNIQLAYVRIVRNRGAQDSIARSIKIKNRRILFVRCDPMVEATVEETRSLEKKSNKRNRRRAGNRKERSPRPGDAKDNKKRKMSYKMIINRNKNSSAPGRTANNRKKKMTNARPEESANTRRMDRSAGKGRDPSKKRGGPTGSAKRYGRQRRGESPRLGERKKLRTREEKEKKEEPRKRNVRVEREKPSKRENSEIYYEDRTRKVDKSSKTSTGSSFIYKEMKRR